MCLINVEPFDFIHFQVAEIQLTIKALKDGTLVEKRKMEPEKRYSAEVPAKFKIMQRLIKKGGNRNYYTI